MKILTAPITGIEKLYELLTEPAPLPGEIEEGKRKLRELQEKKDRLRALSYEVFDQTLADMRRGRTPKSAKAHGILRRAALHYGVNDDGTPKRVDFEEFHKEYSYSEPLLREVVSKVVKMVSPHPDISPFDAAPEWERRRALAYKYFDNPELSPRDANRLGIPQGHGKETRAQRILREKPGSDIESFHIFYWTDWDLETDARALAHEKWLREAKKRAKEEASSKTAARTETRAAAPEPEPDQPASPAPQATASEPETAPSQPEEPLPDMADLVELGESLADELGESLADDPNAPQPGGTSRL